MARAKVRVRLNARVRARVYKLQFCSFAQLPSYSCVPNTVPYTSFLRKTARRYVPYFFYRFRKDHTWKSFLLPNSIGIGIGIGIGI